MTDPFSVAGSAVGVVSLGVTVCQGLLTYYDKFKGQDDDVKYLTNKIKSLLSILESLKRLLIQPELTSLPDTREYVDIVATNISLSQEAIEKLEQALQKCTATKVAESESSHRFQIKKMLYPFRHETIMSLDRILAGLQANLNTSLQALQLATVGISQRTEALSTTIAQDMGQISGELGSLSQIQAELLQKYEGINQRLDEISSTMIVYGPRPIQSQGLLRSLSDDQQRLRADLRSFRQQSEALRNRWQRRCTCWHSAPLRFATSFVFKRGRIHETGCPLFFPGQYGSMFMMRYAFWSKLLGFSVEAAMMVRTGAGEFAISPHLVVQYTVSNDSPAFQLLKATGCELNIDRLNGLAEGNEIIRRTRAKLHDLFVQGKASPNDILPNGAGLLHEVIEWGLGDPYLRLQECRELIKDLLTAGVPTTQEGDLDPVKRLLSCNLTEHTEEWMGLIIEICMEVAGVSGHLRDEISLALPLQLLALSGGNYRVHLLTSLLRQLFERCEASFDINVDAELSPVIMAIISQSPEKFRKLLLEEKSVDEDRGELLYRWCSDWPSGISELLKAGIPGTNQALAVACGAGCIDSVAALLNCLKCPILPIDILAACCCGNTEIRSLVLHALAERRKTLQSLAVAHLPEDSDVRVHLRDDRVLDIHASAVMEQLEAEFVPVDEFIEVTYSFSTYLLIQGDAEAADILYLLGFRDIDEVDDKGQTPLMRLSIFYRIRGLSQTLEMAAWLIKKGAKLFRPIKGSKFRAIHGLGDTIGSTLFNLPEFNLWTAHVSIMLEKHTERYLEKLSSNILSLDSDSIDLLRQICLNRAPDECKCACAIKGCSPLSRMLKILLAIGKAVDAIMAMIAVLANSIFLGNETDFYDSVASTVLRFYAFTRLELTHTCCDFFYYENEVLNNLWYPNMFRERPHYAVEIQDEEEELITQLDNLVSELERKYHEMGVPLPEFLGGYCKRRLDQELSAERPWDPDETRKVRELGVIFDSR